MFTPGADSETGAGSEAEAQAQAAAAPQAAPATPAEIVDTWFVERIHGTAISRNVEAYNVLYEALGDLKARLANKGA